MLHEPAAESGPDPAFAFKRRLGVRMFAVYAIVYAVFIAINVVRPTAMEIIVLAGLDLAVVYGFGLIVLALAMALVYSAACGRREKSLIAGGGN